MSAQTSSAETGMTLVEHLTELRKRLIICIAAVGIGNCNGVITGHKVIESITSLIRSAVETVLQSTGSAVGVNGKAAIGIAAGGYIAVSICYKQWRLIDNYVGISSTTIHIGNGDRIVAGSKVIEVTCRLGWSSVEAVSYGSCSAVGGYGECSVIPTKAGH